MIIGLSENDNLIRFQYNSLYRSLDKNQKLIYNNINDYLTSYCKFNNLKINNVIEIHREFISNYKRNTEYFINSSNYPHLNNEQHYSISRESYDVILILSCLLLKHRFRIMELLLNSTEGLGKLSFIGVGSGLELYLLKDKIKNFKAFDISISKFIEKNFSDRIINDFFENSSYNFDMVIAIELLEHLDEPYDLINDVYNSLLEKGIFITTTAKDIPQFDHLHNFIDETEFEDHVMQIGFDIIKKDKINHENFDKRFKPNNIFYILKK